MENTIKLEMRNECVLMRPYGLSSFSSEIRQRISLIDYWFFWDLNIGRKSIYDFNQTEIIDEMERLNMNKVEVSEDYLERIVNDYYHYGLDHQINSNNYNKNKEALIVMGLPGSGKSTKVITPFCKEYKAVELDNDIIKELMVEYNENGLCYERCHKASKQVFNLLLPKLASEGYNLAIPIIGRTDKSFLKIYDELMKNGYHIQICYVKVEKEESLKRCLNRFLETGRYVSLNYVNDDVQVEDIENTFKMASLLKGVTKSYVKYN